MRVKFFVLFFVLLQSSILSSDDLFSYYVGTFNDVLAAVPTPDGGTILAGRIYTGRKYTDALLLRLNTAGGAEWKLRLGGEKDERFDAIAPLRNGTYIAAGLTSTFVKPQQFVTSDILIVCFDVAGKILWRKTIGARGEDYAVSATATSDGGVVILAHTNSFGDPDPELDTNSDFLVIKLNPSGKILWSMNLAVSTDDHAISSIELKDGSVLLAGHGGGVKLIKIDQAGKILWAKNLNELSVFKAMAQLQDGNILLNCWQKVTGESVLIKISPSGIVLYSKRITAYNNSVDVSTIAADDSGGAIISAITLDQRMVLLRVDRHGIVQWKNIFDSRQGEIPTTMLKATDGSMIHISSLYEFSGAIRTAIEKFKQSGEMFSCHSEVPSIQLKSIKVHSKRFTIVAERNLRLRLTSPKLTFAEPNLPFETICP